MVALARTTPPKAERQPDFFGIGAENVNGLELNANRGALRIKPQACLPGRLARRAGGRFVHALN
jgi:hypothetical protein